MLRPETPAPLKQQLAAQLAKITGWNDLGFNAEGALVTSEENPTTGSKTARELLRAAEQGDSFVIIEDASNRSDVVFCKVVPGRWKNDSESNAPVYVVLVDFVDFTHVIGDKQLLDSFNAGWGLLHEVAHVVDKSIDADEYGELGECETLINQMRRECGLAERGEYFFTYLPNMSHSDFQTRYVRLAFDESSAENGKKKRRWLMWDATIVGEAVSSQYSVASGNRQNTEYSRQ
jgi:hypothetical protein